MKQATFLSLLLVLIALPAEAQDSSAGAPAVTPAFCLECLSVRVGPPRVIRGPFPDELDSAFSALVLPDGSFRGFSSNSTAYAVDGADIRSMDGARRQVLGPAPAGRISDCGRWINGVVRLTGQVFALVHQEHNCDYANSQTHKSMGVAVSADDGLHWTNLGTIISGTTAPKAGATTGEGDCTWVDGHDGYRYAYCLRLSDWQTVVARAPAERPEPGAWNKFHDGEWNEPGLGGDATAIGFFGMGSGYVEPFDRIALVVNDLSFAGLRLSVSADKLNFESLAAPLVPIDGEEWRRPAATGLIAYPSIINPEDGSNDVGPNFILSYVYVPPGEDFDRRYLVFHEVGLSMGEGPLDIQTGIGLGRWRDAASSAFRTSSGPAIAPGSDYRFDRLLGYLATSPPDAAASVRLEECAVDGRPDYFVAVEGECARQGYRSVRTAGWAFDEARHGTVPLYGCIGADATRFNAIDPACEKMGTVETRLGFVFRE